jgi:thiopurine S-methyltransferase
MQHEFWLERWQLNQIGFHNQQINRHLKQNWSLLNQPTDSVIFVPFCGKSKDMLWLRDQGHQVIGVELSPLAVEAFFIENGLSVKTVQQDKFKVFETDKLRIYCGDFFDLTANELLNVNAVYDRASLVALPPEMRLDYTVKIRQLLRTGTQILLIAFEYLQHEMQGPPFSVHETEVSELYGNWCDVKLLYSEDIYDQEPHFRERGLSRIQEEIYILSVK